MYEVVHRFGYFDNVAWHSKFVISAFLIRMVPSNITTYD